MSVAGYREPDALVSPAPAPAASRWARFRCALFGHPSNVRVLWERWCCAGHPLTADGEVPGDFIGFVCERCGRTWDDIPDVAVGEAIFQYVLRIMIARGVDECEWCRAPVGRQGARQGGR